MQNSALRVNIYIAGIDFSRQVNKWIYSDGLI